VVKNGFPIFSFGRVLIRNSGLPKLFGQIFLVKNLSEQFWIFKREKEDSVPGKIMVELVELIDWEKTQLLISKALFGNAIDFFVCFQRLIQFGRRSSSL